MCPLSTCATESGYSVRIVCFRVVDYDCKRRRFLLDIRLSAVHYCIDVTIDVAPIAGIEPTTVTIMGGLMLPAELNRLQSDKTRCDHLGMPVIRVSTVCALDVITRLVPFLFGVASVESVEFFLCQHLFYPSSVLPLWGVDVYLMFFLSSSNLCWVVAQMKALAKDAVSLDTNSSALIVSFTRMVLVGSDSPSAMVSKDFAIHLSVMQ